MDKGQSFVRRKRKEEMFTRLSNYMLRDERLSWKARGLLSYMLSMPDDWVFYETELVKHSKKDGITSLRSAMKELKEFGYVTKEPLRDEKGKVIKWVTYVEEEPIQNTENLECGFSTSSETHNVDNQTLLTTDYLLTTENIQTTNKNNKPSEFDTLLELYNSIEQLPKYRALSDKRKSHIKARLKEYGWQDCKDVLIKASLSKFLTDKNNGWFTIDWIFNPTNFLKILEGAYDNKGNNNQRYNPYGALESEIEAYKREVLNNDDRRTTIAIPENVNTLF